MRPFLDGFSSPAVLGKHLNGWIVRRFGPDGFEAQAFQERKPAHALYQRWLTEYEESADDGFGPLEKELNKL